MNKMERFHAAVAGEAVDRVPISLWLHFVTDYLDGAESARLHARFIRHYDWDLAKAISDYRCPLAEGMETLDSPRDMLRVKPKSMDRREFQEQFRLLRVLRADLGSDWPVIDTSFDPVQQITRLAGASRAAMIFENPKESHPMLEAATETVCRYVRELKRIGVDGVLYSTHGAISQPHPIGIDDATFREFFRPYDIRVLEEMEGMVRILHPCLTHLDMDRIKDYPCEVVSWWDRGVGCPSMAEMRRKTDKCLMGGFDHMSVIERPLPDLRDEINDALDQVNGRGIILAPGCTIRSQVPERTLRCVRETVNAWSVQAAA